MAAAMAWADEGYTTLERHRRGSPTVHYARTSVVAHLFWGHKQRTTVRFMSQAFRKNNAWRVQAVHSSS